MDINWLDWYEMNTESYIDAQQHWPCKRSRPGGNWILATYDHESVIVYQAYNQGIARFACEYGRFNECPNYNEQRMTCQIKSFA
jgi:hypothetical protein